METVQSKDGALLTPANIDFVLKEKAAAEADKAADEILITTIEFG